MLLAPSTISAEVPLNVARARPLWSTITADKLTVARAPEPFCTSDSTVTSALFPATLRLAACT